MIPEYKPGEFEAMQTERLGLDNLGMSSFDSNTDLMYVTSISTLVFITILVVSVIIQVTSSKYHRALSD